MPTSLYYMKHINDAVIRLLEARIQVLKIELQDAIDGNADERKILELKTAIQEYTLMPNNLNSK